MARILVVSFGLAAHNLRLMPWRTVMEVAQGLRLRGHEVLVLSVADRTPTPSYLDSGKVVTLARRKVGKMRQELEDSLKLEPVDVVFLPVSLSNNKLMRKLFEGIGNIRIGYLPGSAFEFKQIVRIIGRMPLRSIFPYVAQSLFPRRLLARSIDNLKINALITNSEYSTNCLKSAANIPVVTIAPGRDPVEPNVLRSVKPEDLLTPPPYFLFMGPPLAIRGIYVLLDAYLSIADEVDIPPLLCLFRSDAHLNMAALRERIEQRWAHQKINFVWTSLSPQALQNHIQMATCIIMPFLIVPSEIPLAVYEAAGMGKTVITTGPHGTGDFVSTFGEAVPPGNALALAHAMRKIARRQASKQNEENERASAAFYALDDWQTVADRWEALANQIQRQARWNSPDTKTQK